MTAREIYESALEHHRNGRLAEAEAHYRRVLELEPNQAAAIFGLAGIAHQSGRVEDAIKFLERAIELNPNHGIFFSALAKLRELQSRWVEAAEAFRRAALLQPDRPEPSRDLAHALLRIGRPELAERAARQSLAIQPQAEAQNYLVGALINMGRIEQAIAAAHEAVARWPDDLNVYRSLGWACREGGQLDTAQKALKQGLMHAPHPQLYSDYLFTLHFQEGFDRQRLREEHRRWYEACAKPLRDSIAPHANDRSPARRLRIGYVAHDLGNVPLGRFFLPLPAHHDRANFEVYCYADHFRQDHTGEEIRTKVDVPRVTTGMSQEQFAQLIRQDSIDILVDLAMHTNMNRQMAFARKPAPVQVTYLAYCSTTGQEAIDYRFTDRYLDPPDVDDDLFAEKSVRLTSFWCYRPPPEAPDVGVLPALAKGHVTFGCLNEYAKVSPSALKTWFSILQQVPNSKMVLHAKMGTHRQRVLDLAAREGLGPQRFDFNEFLPLRQYFAQYNQIDIALDSFPYAGGTTTCDALYMGVPVVSLAGQAAVGRGGCSILTNIGLPELVTQSPEQYIQLATTLATDLPRLADLRMGLRKRMRESPVMDAPRFVREIEDAYRMMWRRWCETPAMVK